MSLPLGETPSLNVVERVGCLEVKVARGKINLYVSSGTSVENRALALTEFYRAALKARVEKLINGLQNTIGITVSVWGDKKMKTK